MAGSAMLQRRQVSASAKRRSGAMPQYSKLPVLFLSLILSGCGAPSYNLFGAFFPAWMLCALFGIGVALVVRVAVATSGLVTAIPYQLAVCSAIGVIAAVLVWLVFFGL